MSSIQLKTPFTFSYRCVACDVRLSSAVCKKCYRCNTCCKCLRCGSCKKLISFGFNSDCGCGVICDECYGQCVLHMSGRCPVFGRQRGIRCKKHFNQCSNCGRCDTCCNKCPIDCSKPLFVGGQCFACRSQIYHCSQHESHHSVSHLYCVRCLSICKSCGCSIRGRTIPQQAGCRAWFNEADACELCRTKIQSMVVDDGLHIADVANIVTSYLESHSLDSIYYRTDKRETHAQVILID